MTQEELLVSDLAQKEAETQANALVSYTKALIADANLDVNALDIVYEALKPLTIAALDNLNNARSLTAIAAVEYNPTFIAPLFDAYNLTEIPQDQNIYLPLKTEIDLIIETLYNYNQAVINEADALKELNDRKTDLETAITQNTLAKTLLENLNKIQDSLESEADVQLTAAEKLQAEIDLIAELARIEELRLAYNFSENTTKEIFFFKFDVESDERFVMEKFYEADEDTFDIYNSNFLNTIKELARFGEYIVTNEEQRIDVISYEIYGSTQYWWMLLEYNDIVDQFSIKKGDIINFFDLESLEGKYHWLQKEQHKIGA